ncbi:MULTISPECIES: SdpI family protein [unclassified Microbacterium]|uniref:SdpI family protein n=1 Tax=unclassified Microbacterium TaxID=2609290 RepID=UPI000EAA6D82|nr:MULTISPECIES: SdpI family protein [unclassified Microbacterium]MBT2484184.1 SdpI family protein [Microbacterium sp. ISL-108]RKN67121.1 SdpI family protein [Microbacterium sp. CGR2]
MTDTLFVIAAGFFLTAVIFGSMSRAMKNESFDRNRALGIRTRATLASDEAWSRGHIAPVPWVWSSAIAATVFGLALASLGFMGAEASNPAVIVITLGGFASVLACLIISGIVANRAARATGTGHDNHKQRDVTNEAD